MPLRRTTAIRVTVKEPLPPPLYGDGSAPAFQPEGQPLWAAVQPLLGSTEAKLYGEESAQMLLLLAPPGAALEEGMGVCVKGENGQCDYRVAAPPQRWRTHLRATLKRL